MKNIYRIVLTEKDIGDILIDTDKDMTQEELETYARTMFMNRRKDINWYKTDYDILGIYKMNCEENEEEIDW